MKEGFQWTEELSPLLSSRQPLSAVSTQPPVIVASSKQYPTLRPFSVLLKPHGIPFPDTTGEVFEFDLANTEKKIGRSTSFRDKQKEAHIWETERGGFFLFIVVLYYPGGRGKRGVCLMGFYRQVEGSVSTSCPVPSFFPHSRFRQMPLPRRASVEKRRNSAIPFRINVNKKSPTLSNTKKVEFRTFGSLASPLSHMAIVRPEGTRQRKRKRL